MKKSTVSKSPRVHTNSTRVGTLLDALSPIGDSSVRVSWVDDVAFVSCRTVERFIAVLCCTARLGWPLKIHKYTFITRVQATLAELNIFHEAKDK